MAPANVDSINRNRAYVLQKCKYKLWRLGGGGDFQEEYLEFLFVLEVLRSIKSVCRRGNKGLIYGTLYMLTR